MNRTALWRSALTLLLVAVLIPPGLWLNRRIQIARDVAYFSSFPEQSVSIATESEIDPAVLKPWIPGAAQPWILPLFESPRRLYIHYESDSTSITAPMPLDFERIGRLSSLKLLSLYQAPSDESDAGFFPAQTLTDPNSPRKAPPTQKSKGDPFNWEKGGLRQVARLTQLVGLDLIRVGVTDSSLAPLREMKQLNSLSLCENPITDQGTPVLAGLVKLERLDLSGTKVTRQTIPHLADLKRLQRLYLPDNLELTDDDLSILSELPLTELTINSPHVTAAGFRHVGRMVQLEQLEIKHTTVSPDDLAPLANLTSLKSLRLPADIRLGGCLKHLVGLGVEFNEILSAIITDEDLPHLITNRIRFGRRYLNLSQSQVTDVGLDALRGKPQIHQIDISQTRVTDAGLLPLTTMPDLKLLVLRQTSITDNGLETISRISALEFLDLGETLVTDEGLVHLAKLNRLDMLNLSKTAVTDTGLRVLAELESLSWLNLDETKITDAGLAALASLPNLTKLELSGTCITDAGLEHLLKCPKLQTLMLNRTKVTDAGFRKFTGLTNMKDIEFDGTSVTPGWVENVRPPTK